MSYRFFSNSFLIHSKSCFCAFISLYSFLVVSNVSFAQVSGYVKSTEGKPIAYALVVKSDYKTGGYTDNKGFFSIDAYKNDTLLVKHVAYEDTVIVIDKHYKVGSTVTILLKENNIILNEIVILPETKEKRIKAKYGGFEFLSFQSQSNKIGIWVKPTERSNQLMGVDFYISKDGIPTAPFRVGILKNLDNPNSIYKDYVFEGKADKGNRWIEITFHEPLEIQDSVLLYIEAIAIKMSDGQSIPKKRKKRDNEQKSWGIAIGLSDKVEKKMMWANINETGWMTLEMLYDYKYQFMIEPVFDE